MKGGAAAQVAVNDVIASIDDTLRRAMHAAGCKDEAAFKKLPREEQNAFMAEARGLAKLPQRDGVQLLEPATIRRSPFNREYFDEAALEELACDVRERGVLQAGIVRPVKPPVGKIVWEIIAGERRWRAAIKAKKLFPATVRDVGDTEAMEMQAVENMHREDLNAIDEASKYEQLRTAYEAEGLNRTKAIERISVVTGKATATIYERLSLLKLPSQVIVLVQRGKLPASHAGLLTKLTDPKRMLEVAGQILNPKKNDDEAVGGVMAFRGARHVVDKAVAMEKNLAEWQRQADEFRKKGWEVLTPARSAQVVCGNEYNDLWRITNEGLRVFVKPDTTCQLHGADYRSYDKLWKKAPEPVLARLEDGRPVKLYVAGAADQAVRDGGKLRKGTNGRTSSRPASEIEAEKKQKERSGEFLVTLGSAVKHIELALDSSEFWRFFAVMMVKQWRSDPIKRVAKRRGWAKGGAALADIQRRIPAMGVAELRGLCAEILLFNDWPNQWASGWGDSIRSAAALCKLPLSTWGKSKAGGKFQTSGEGEDDAS